ncbi:hypothetical protein LRS74_15915 [Streptomyces sp. LX-29]|uniref:hypothetical protein n=1 Tax=Streptomyces sp. LX-29 TaxID=2900152 RepID=UPI00240E23C0|nr:hypothetical protein [Streptomyces sp. LX-29]WFB08372.1 hypothetical protein LRS74_15915 [Streptomyces sp. LX-29]
MARLRIRRVTWPRAALVLADTPRPDCRLCDGDGGTAHDYGDYETGEYAGTEWDPCPCWNEDRSWVLLPLPRLPRRRQPHVDPWGNGYSDEPPF